MSENDDKEPSANGLYGWDDEILAALKERGINNVEHNVDYCMYSIHHQNMDRSMPIVAVFNKKTDELRFFPLFKLVPKSYSESGIKRKKKTFLGNVVNIFSRS